MSNIIDFAVPSSAIRPDVMLMWGDCVCRRGHFGLRRPANRQAEAAIGAVAAGVRLRPAHLQRCHAKQETSRAPETPHLVERAAALPGQTARGDRAGNGKGYFAAGSDPTASSVNASTQSVPVPLSIAPNSMVD